MQKILAGPVSSDFRHYLTIWCKEANVELCFTLSESDMEEAILDQSYDLCLVPLFWPVTHGLALMQRVAAKTASISRCVVVLPASFDWAQFSGTDFIVPAYLFPQQASELKECILSFLADPQIDS